MSIAELVRRRTAATVDPSEQVEALQSSLRACVAVLETLVQTGRVDPACHETIERVVKHANRRLTRE